MTNIEIRPFRNGWQVYEAPGVQPVFLSQEQAIDYATCVLSLWLDSRFGFEKEQPAFVRNPEYHVELTFLCVVQLEQALKQQRLHFRNRCANGMRDA
jgi:hypothetical protein